MELMRPYNPTASLSYVWDLQYRVTNQVGPNLNGRPVDRQALSVHVMKFSVTTVLEFRKSQGTHGNSLDESSCSIANRLLC